MQFFLYKESNGCGKNSVAKRQFQPEIKWTLNKPSATKDCFKKVEFNLDTNI